MVLCFRNYNFFLIRKWYSFELFFFIKSNNLFLQIFFSYNRKFLITESGIKILSFLLKISEGYWNINQENTSIFYSMFHRYFSHWQRISFTNVEKRNRTSKTILLLLHMLIMDHSEESFLSLCLKIIQIMEFEKSWKWNNQDSTSQNLQRRFKII